MQRGPHRRTSWEAELPLHFTRGFFSQVHVITTNTSKCPEAIHYLARNDWRRDPAPLVFEPFCLLTGFSSEAATGHSHALLHQMDWQSLYLETNKHHSQVITMHLSRPLPALLLIYLALTSKSVDSFSSKRPTSQPVTLFVYVTALSRLKRGH